MQSCSKWSGEGVMDDKQRAQSRAIAENECHQVVIIWVENLFLVFSDFVFW